MIDSKTVGIECGGSGKAGVELALAVRCVVRRVGTGQRERVQVGLHSGHCILPRREVRDLGQLSLRKAKPKSLVRKEEESSVLENRSVESSAEIVLPLFSFGQRRTIGVSVEPVVGIEHVIAQIVECCA